MNTEPISTETVWEVQYQVEMGSDRWHTAWQHTTFHSAQQRINDLRENAKTIVHYRIVRIVRQTFIEEEK